MLLPSYCFSALAFGGIIVPRLNLVLSLICREYLEEQAALHPGFTFVPVILSGDNPQCSSIPEVNALATRFTLYTGLISGILAAITSPKIGALSDRFGRKPLLILTTVGSLSAEIIAILTARYPDQFHYSWQLAGAVADGVCGSFITGWAMTHSYATDCTPPAKRAVAFGYLHACLFGGIALGPLFAAFIISWTKELLSIFYSALICHLFFLLYIIFVLPESLSPKRQLAAREKYRIEKNASSGDSKIYSSLKSANILGPLKILYPTGPGSSAQVRANLLLLSAVDTIIFGAAMGAMTVVIYYSMFQFKWQEYETNLFVSIANSCRVFALVIVLPVLNYVVRIRPRNRARRESGITPVQRNSGSDNLDLWTIRASVIFEILGYGGYALVRSGELFIMCGIFASLGGIGSPTLQSALTKHVPQDRTGQLLGATGLLHALARVVCPTVFSLIYAGTVGSFPQLVFWVLAACFVVAFVCSWFVRPHGMFPDSLSPLCLDSIIKLRHPPSQYILKNLAPKPPLDWHVKPKTRQPTESSMRKQLESRDSSNALVSRFRVTSLRRLLRPILLYICTARLVYNDTHTIYILSQVH